MSIIIAGVNGTFKTVPKRYSQFSKGCFLIFHVHFRNAVSWANLIVKLEKLFYSFNSISLNLLQV